MSEVDKHVEEILLDEGFPDVDVRSILRKIYHQTDEPFLSSGYEWSNKPHRIMKDCCCRIAQLERELQEARELASNLVSENAGLKNKIDFLEKGGLE
jgi:hypothetical protein